MTQPDQTQTRLTHGFALEREQFISELSATARIYRHAKTGGRLLSLSSSDENKVFGIALRTPPSDHTGLPHILEHSVLCGSEKYPVKEPFVELIKGSLNTFLNALTFPDKTCYPVASANVQDFYNLVEVYLDAVFHPRLTENTLRQEGWHYDIEKPEDELSIKGVVYNEMKGAYSSPDSLLSEYSQRALYPDNCYGVDSGGDPERIPDLTFEQFMDFHRRLYHPANAYAFFSGDDDPDKRLEIMDAAFSRFEALPGGPDSEVGVQAKFDAPRRFVHFYAADAPEDMDEMDELEEGEDESAAPDTPAHGPKAMCTVNFGLPQIVDKPADEGADLSLALNVLEHVLIGLPSSPLRKALVDSGLGEDITGGGLETDLRQMSFTVGLKGMAAATAEQDADKVQALVLSTLEGLEQGGLHADDIAAAINSVEFDLRENNTGSYPRGLALFFESLATWLYDGDPLMLLPFEGPLARLKARLAAGEKVFEGLIREHFLANTHRALVLLRPDPGLGKRREAEEKAKLAAIRAAMSQEQIAELVQQTLTLRELQEAPDAPEDLARIPRLGLADLPPENAIIPQGCGCINGAKLMLHDLPTSGIVYLDLGLDLSAVPDRLLPFVPILGRALFEMGTQKTGFVDLTRKIAMTTGGLWGQAFVSSVRTEDGHCAPDPAQRLFLRGKATAANVPALLGILSEVLEAPAFDNSERLAKIILESKARREQRLIPAGHTLAASRLKARTGPAQAMADAMHGVSGFLWLRELAARVQANPEETCAQIAADLRELLSLMLCRRTLVAGLTAGGTQLADAAWRLENMVATLPCSLPEGATPKAPRAIPDLPEREGLVLPAQVNYAAWGANLRELSAQPGLASGVVCKYLRAGYLWERVRVQGGAYGAGVSYSRTSGNLTFSSYRDPNTGRTVEAFQGVAPYLAALDLDPAELEKSIVGTIGDMDHYMLPDAKGFTALARRLTGESEEHRQRVRESILGATAEDFRDFGRSVEAAAKNGRVVIAGGREALEQSGLDLTLTRLL